MPNSVRNRISIEAGISQGWERYIGFEGNSIAINKYGSSGPADTVFEKYGFTVENVVTKVRKMMKK